MTIDETIVFIDGENLVIRYQEMIKAGYKPRPNNIHINDVFVWNNDIFSKAMWRLKRVSYYTSAIGDDEFILKMCREISNVHFRAVFDVSKVIGPLGNIIDMTSGRTGQILPFVKKRNSKSNKSSICDISIAIDIMRTCYRDHSDAIYLISGDGDFADLHKEIAHSGKVCYVGALSSGLNKSIPHSVDEFFNLDDYFFIKDESAQQADAPEPLTRPGDP